LGLLIGGACYQLLHTDLRAVAQLIPLIDYLSLLTPFWTWIFARRLFERDPPRALLTAFVVIYSVSWFIAHFLPPIWEVGFYIIHITSLMLIADLIYVALSDRKDDLVEKRRTIRIYLPLLIGLQAGGILLFELVNQPGYDSPIIQAINGAMIFALVVFGGLALLTVDEQLMIRATDADSRTDSTPRFTPAQQVLHERLIAVMDDGGYRAAGLTIAALADQMNTPEHRLRALINQQLGHRNFSAFLNTYRIAEAKAKLSDRDQVNLPILTIAMDLGYGSLAPFNRAFRAETGMAPSEFRRQAIDDQTIDQN
jgi:AraC-like DNA-binding protein